MPFKGDSLSVFIYLIGVFKVYGNSMLPSMSNGDFVITSCLLMRLKEGDVVVAEHPVYGRLIKRVVVVSSESGLRLAGENDSSVSSDDIGWVPMSHILGKVHYLIKGRSI